MKRFLKIPMIGILVSLFFIGCAMSNFTLTGNKYPPLSEDAQVAVIMRAVPDYKVEQIGIVNLQCGMERQCVEKAQKVARQNGGDVVVLVKTDTGFMYNQGMATTYYIHTYEVCKKVLKK